MKLRWAVCRSAPTLEPKRWIGGRLVYCVLLALGWGSVGAETPDWIWHRQAQPGASNEIRLFYRSFVLTNAVKSATLIAAADGQMMIALNGRMVANSVDITKPGRAEVAAKLVPGTNTLAAWSKLHAGGLGWVARLELVGTNDERWQVSTDKAWVSSDAEPPGWSDPGFVPVDWQPVAVRGPLGMAPWGDVLTPPAATPAERLATLPGFKVELLRSSAVGEGSWIAMTVDPQGRLILSPQEGVSNMLRVTLTARGQVAKVERLRAPVGSAMGLLYAHASLYVSGLGPDGLCLYRLLDQDGQGNYAPPQKIQKLPGAGGEHGSHAVVAGPDGKIYQVHGNFVRVPAERSPQSPLRNYAEDLLLPRAEDGNGFGIGLKPPAGFVTRSDPDGSHLELFAGGLRNVYDIAFNEDGELFAFDSDMEWDWGTPWYRATRIHHVVSGGDYGFREGTGKWPYHYADGLPPILEAGIGSPTGMKFGTGSHFPGKYQHALFAMDWSYGRILAVHLSPEGSSYRATMETLVAPRSLREPGPKATLTVTDLEFGQDGALYFITGGRATQSGLYRVTYEGQRTAEAKVEPSAAAHSARAERRRLESFHGRVAAPALDAAWPHLDSADRWLRHAARVAIEAQPVEQWQDRALAETRPQAALTALLALARCGKPSAQGPLLLALGKVGSERLSEDQALQALRVLELTFIRLGPPAPEVRRQVKELLSPKFPSGVDAIDRELMQVLLYLGDPSVVARAMARVAAAETQEEQLDYLFYLRNQREGWTAELRHQYFTWFTRDRRQARHPAELLGWFQDVGRTYEDGASLNKFLTALHRQALASLSAAELSELGPLAKLPEPASRKTAEPAATRRFVKEWRVSDLLPLLDRVSAGRSFERGRQAFNDARCELCHRFAGLGGSVGPELTSVATKYTRREILESLLDPSKVVSEQFQNMMFYLKDGDEEIGRVVEEDDEKVVIVTDPLHPDHRMELRKSNINTREASRVSPMPEGLVNILSEEDILDLLAYLESGGNPSHAVFGRKSSR